MAARTVTASPFAHLFHARLRAADTERMLDEILREDLVDQFDQTGEADFALMIEGVGRFRVNAFRQRGNVGLVLRRVSVGAIPLQDLGLPEPVAALALRLVTA